MRNLRFMVLCNLTKAHGQTWGNKGGKSPTAHWVTLQICTANSEGLPGTVTHWLSEVILSALPHFPLPPCAITSEWALQENSLRSCLGSHYYHTLQSRLREAECLGWGHTPARGGKGTLGFQLQTAYPVWSLLCFQTSCIHGPTPWFCQTHKIYQFYFVLNIFL